jgi:hypothetical protein
MTAKAKNAMCRQLTHQCKGRVCGQQGWQGHCSCCGLGGDVLLLRAAHHGADCSSGRAWGSGGGASIAGSSDPARRHTRCRCMAGHLNRAERHAGATLRSGLTRHGADGLGACSKHRRRDFGSVDVVGDAWAAGWAAGAPASPDPPLTGQRHAAEAGGCGDGLHGAWVSRGRVGS